MTELQYLEFEPPGVSDGGLRELIAELNMEIVRCTVATAPGLRECWHALCGAARQRVAACPFLLVDAGLARPELWARLRDLAVCEAVPVRTLLASRSALPTPLLRRVLLLVWHLARTNRTGARLVLGMSANCASVVAGCRLADLEALAERRPGWIRPRWEQHPEVWRAWLTAAAKESPRSLERLQIWGLQTLAADVRRQSA
jgi:hypothetical protein